MILTECCIASCHKGAPETAGAPEPPASAIICAYMPNEQYTIKETIDHFLALDYAPGLQVILSYNSPFYCPIEAELRELAKIHPNFDLLKVKGSTSKAENLNTALKYVTGEFVACFDADHMPEQGSFERAWRWLSNGYDVVQGHCLVRNPEESFWAKMVAIEFETIYALAHPGRTVRDGFGVFGGSNGYWNTALLQRIGMVGAMLTEDIDSSMRVIEEGGKIGTDPELISLELATSTFLQVWNQRLRWAQGWMQVSIKHLWPMIRNPHFGIRSKLGAFMLLFVREIYPWISMQIIPLLIFWYIRGDNMDWKIPLFITSSIYTSVIGPITVLVTFGLAHPSLKKPWWFVIYAFFSVLFYTELKNVICRVALIKQIFGETGWRVTPRSANAPVKELDGSADENGLPITDTSESLEFESDTDTDSDWMNTLETEFDV
ncbi:Poly-beta-1,6-N-acetyl-D-glucosamine synthase [Seminavis robusta]|uniref:Poly-beta-1,6-N-acetyl-D-glucosamine synthase n=1 Tax=Seminavis robusta TaxID=568900 RepID=A0A9N8F2P6_9STRA|nr:Poly-beta-1,6-N-acetyl-D-glucosamine synthase [Seminavis robusta]|eukprot:Sro2464_g328500.1 Poly-beta-1,6-N-acetyl-D-glucosamine synthase (434) ;mRNA; f:7563-8864